MGTLVNPDLLKVANGGMREVMGTVFRYWIAQNGRSTELHGKLVVLFRNDH